MNRRSLLALIGFAPAAVAAKPALAAPSLAGHREKFMAVLNDVAVTNARVDPATLAGEISVNAARRAAGLRPLRVEVSQRVEFADGRVLELGKDDQVFTTLEYVKGTDNARSFRSVQGSPLRERRYISDHAYLIDGDGI